MNVVEVLGERCRGGGSERRMEWDAKTTMGTAPSSTLPCSCAQRPHGLITRSLPNTVVAPIRAGKSGGRVYTGRVGSR